MNSQPDCWRRSADVATAGGLPEHGSRVALVGCGTSRYMAEAVAAWREGAGLGESDAFAASEMPHGRAYDFVVVISRSGTTTEILRVIDETPSHTKVLAITGSASTPVARAAGHNISLPFADEQAVVQTRFATSVCALWRAHLGHDVEHLAQLAEHSLAAPLPVGLSNFRQFVFLGEGPAPAWPTRPRSSYERHHCPGPRHTRPWNCVTGRSACSKPTVWSGRSTNCLTASTRRWGPAGPPSSHPRPAGIPLAELVRAERAAIALAQAKGIDPSQPRRLSRSIVLK